MNNDTINKDNFRDLIDIYISKWKWIALSVIIAFSFAYINLKYTPNQYQSTASIKLNDDKGDKKLSELTALQDYGLFSSNSSNVIDEVQVIKSRSILTKVVEELGLNINFHVLGRVKDQEVFMDPPLNLNFIASDSTVHKMSTTFYVTIIDENTFKTSKKNSKKLFSLDKEDENSKVYSFGDRIESPVGDLIITPNIGVYGTEKDAVVKVSVRAIANVVESYQGKIKIGTTKQSNVLTLSLKEHIKSKAELILDKLIEKYNEDAVNDKEAVVKATSDFINNRLEIVSNELEQVDLTAETLKKNNRLSDLGTQSSIFLQTEKENEQRLITTTNQIQLIDYMSDYMSEGGRDTDLLPANVGIENSNVSAITKNYNDLVLQRDRILKNSSDKNPTVVNLNSQINALKNNLDQSLKNLRSSSEITLSALNKEDRRISSQIYSAPKKERQFRNIERQQGIKESLYLYLLEKREETAITLGMSSPNAKIIQSAYTSGTPVAPKRKVIYLASLLLGLFIPIGLIYVIDLLDTKVHNKNDVLKLVKAPFIGDIPKSTKRKQIVNKIDYSPKAEAFRLLRTNINFLLKNKDEKGKTIFVTSTTKQEGKSHTSVNLASSFSFSEQKVLLLETDIRVPRVTDYLNVDAQKGLTDYISDPDLQLEDIIITDAINEHLHVIPSGTIPPNPAELLMNDRVAKLFEKIKKEYNYIIVDTAAVGLVTDTLLISHFADMFVYVISANNVDKRQLHIAQTMYEENRLPNVVTLLNGTTKKKGYGYGYGNDPKTKKWYKFS